MRSELLEKITVGANYPGLSGLQRAELYASLGHYRFCENRNDLTDHRCGQDPDGGAPQGSKERRRTSLLTSISFWKSKAQADLG